MDILYLLIPIAVLLVAAMVAGFLWASKTGQFDDLEGPAHRILMEEDEPQEPVPGKHEPEKPGLPPKAD
jgi:cbb3-type cytochrome oxidase maturation protein